MFVNGYGDTTYHTPNPGIDEVRVLSGKVVSYLSIELKNNREALSSPVIKTVDGKMYQTTKQNISFFYYGKINGFKRSRGSSSTLLEDRTIHPFSGKIPSPGRLRFDVSRRPWKQY